MFWFSVLDFKHSKLCWILLTKFSSSKVLVWLFIELLTVSFILMLLELKIPVFSMCSSLVKSRLLFKFELMPDNELDDKRLLIPITPFLICWSLNWMKSRRALLAASIRASFFDFPWPTYFWPSTLKWKVIAHIYHMLLVFYTLLTITDIVKTGAWYGPSCDSNSYTKFFFSSLSMATAFFGWGSWFDDPEPFPLRRLRDDARMREKKERKMCALKEYEKREMRRGQFKFSFDLKMNQKFS